MLFILNTGLLIWSFFAGTFQAISDPAVDMLQQGKLTYFKFFEDGSKQFIQLSITGKVSFDASVETARCSLISTNATFLAVVNNLNRQVQVFRFSDKNLTASYDLPANWNPQQCNSSWVNDIELRLTVVENTVAQSEIVNVIDNTIRYESRDFSSSSITTTIDQLPDKVTAENVILSPNSRMVVYSQCLNQAYSPDQTFCTGENQVVLYDLTDQTVVEVLPDATIMENLYQTDVMRPIPDYINWSPSGRYLLYFTYDDTDRIRLYDVQTKQYIDAGSLIAANPHPFSGFTWSPAESKIGFWEHNISGDTIFPPQKFAVFDIAAQTTRVYESAFTLNGQNNLRWSPDQQAIALVTRERELVVLNLVDGTHSILDTEVYGLHSWVE